MGTGQGGGRHRSSDSEAARCPSYGLRAAGLVGDVEQAVQRGHVRSVRDSGVEGLAELGVVVEQVHDP